MAEVEAARGGVRLVVEVEDQLVVLEGVMVAADLLKRAVDGMLTGAQAVGHGAGAVPAGPRGDGGFHGGYFRDLDGNKLVAFCM